MSHRNEQQVMDMAAVNAELERLMAEEEALKQEVKEIIKNLEFRI